MKIKHRDGSDYSSLSLQFTLSAHATTYMVMSEKEKTRQTEKPWTDNVVSDHCCFSTTEKNTVRANKSLHIDTWLFVCHLTLWSA